MSKQNQTEFMKTQHLAFYLVMLVQFAILARQHKKW